MPAAYYCVWGSCQSWEYCCGRNKCCDEQDFNALLLTAIVIGTLIVAALCCAFFYCKSRRICSMLLKRYFGINYVMMPEPEVRESDTATVNRIGSENTNVVQLSKNTVNA